MDVKNIKISLTLGESAGKKREEISTEVLNIRVMLGERGLFWLIEAMNANKATFDDIMGSGWTERFGNEIGDVLEQSTAMNLLLLKRGNEIVTRGTEKMKKEGRL